MRWYFGSQEACNIHVFSKSKVCSSCKRPTLVSFRRTRPQALQHRRRAVGCDQGTVEDMVLILRFLVFFFLLLLLLKNSASRTLAPPVAVGCGRRTARRCRRAAWRGPLSSPPLPAGAAGPGGSTAPAGGPAVRGVSPAVPKRAARFSPRAAGVSAKERVRRQPAGNGRAREAVGQVGLPPPPPPGVGRAGGRFPAAGARPPAPVVGGEARWRAGGGGHGGGGASSPSERGVWAR